VKIILKGILKNSMKCNEINSPSSAGHRLMVSSCKCSLETSDSIKGGGFIEKMNEDYLLFYGDNCSAFM
jgi:hypothetical protein